MSPRCLILIAAAALTVSCGDSTADLLNEEGIGRSGGVVGGACAADGDCAPGSRCLTGSDFPGGTCAKACASDKQCPSGTICVDEEQGVCLLSCLTPADCRGGYSCEGKDRKVGDGDVLVCASEDKP